MRITLVTQHANARFMPLALLYLKASLVADGAAEAGDVTVVEFNDATTVDAMTDAILATTPEVVGFSCYVWNIVAFREVSRCMRAAFPGVKIVFGGPEVGPVSERVLERDPQIDVVVRSEGEVPICDLVRCWRLKGDLAAVPGITWRSGARVVQNMDASIVRDLNQVASPHFANYLDPTRRVICLETQRGCVLKCSFCFYNKDYSIRNRRFALDRVKEELRFWLAQDVQQIYLMDPIFNLHAARAKEICQFIAAHNTRRIPIHTEAWAEFIDEEMAALFAAANFTFIEIGLQTSDHAVLEAVDRRFKRQQFIEGLGHLNAYGLPYELQLIAGLPGDSLQTLRASLDFAVSFAPPHLAVFDLMVLPGTELSRSAERLGLRYDPDPPYHIRAHPSMPEADMAYARDFAHSAHTLWRFQTIRLLVRDGGGAFAALVDDWLRWRSTRAERDEAAALLPAFVEHWCADRPRNQQFFAASAAVEARAGTSSPPSSGRS